MKNPLLLILPFLFFTVFLSAQSIERQLIGTAGEIDSGDRISLDWTLGESFIISNQAAFYHSKEGFLQPENLGEESLEDNTENAPALSNHFSAKVFPNPINSAFVFQINQVQDHDAQLAILDYSGKVLTKKGFPSGTLKTEWNLDNYPAGLYFLQFTNDTGTLNYSFKLLKL